MIKTYASIFTGIGGFDLPAKERGWKIMFQVERDEFCLGRLQNNFPGVPRHGSVESFETLPYQGKIDLLTSGFPCQPFSPLGKQKGTDDERYVWEHNKRILRELRPRLFIAENVRRIISSEAFEHVCCDLEEIGYKVWPFVFPTGITDGYDMRYRTIFFAYSAQYRVSESKIQTAIINHTPLQSKKEGEYFSVRVYGANNVVLPGLSESDLIRETNGVPSWMDRIKTCGNAVHVGFVRQLYTAIESIDNCLEPMENHEATDNPKQKTTTPAGSAALPEAQQLPATPAGTNIFYPGNKHIPGVYQKLINQVPPHDVYCSGTCGTDAVMSHMRPATRNIGIDPNADALQQYWAARSDVQLIKNDFFTWIAQFTFSKQMAQQWFIYLDPPYLFSSRRSGAIIYDHEWTDEDHHRLIAWAILITNTSNVKIAISHYPCPEYEELLKHGWRKIEYQVRTRRGTVTEALYMNYPECEELHDYTYLGNDRTERQLIDRQVTNVLKKLERLPTLKRNAVLARVKEKLLQQGSATPPLENEKPKPQE